MLFYLFVILAVLAFSGFFIAAQKGYATRMLYSLVMVLIWASAAAWAGGYING
jgi:hypothetical protein